MITRPSDFRHDGDSVALPDGFSLVFSSEYDQSHGAPWEECDGHGLVSDWTTRDKRSGEWLLCSDRCSRRYYDAAEANRIAKRDKWGLGPEQLTQLAQRLGHAPSKGEIRAEAVRRDFQWLQDWCDDRWQWIVVTITLRDADGEEADSRSVGGVESCGTNYQDIARELADELIAEHEKDLAGAADYAARC